MRRSDERTTAAAARCAAASTRAVQHRAPRSRRRNTAPHRRRRSTHRTSRRGTSARRRSRGTRSSSTRRPSRASSGACVRVVDDVVHASEVCSCPPHPSLSPPPLPPPPGARHGRLKRQTQSKSFRSRVVAQCFGSQRPSSSPRCGGSIRCRRATRGKCTTVRTVRGGVVSF